MLSTSAASLRRLTQLPVALKPRNPSGLLTRRPQASFRSYVNRSPIASGFGNRKLLESLSEQQKKIVQSDASQIITLAGPGTGKSVTAAAKVVHLVENRNIKAEDILILTQGEKAARQIQHLVDVNTQYTANSTTIKTISAFSSMVLEDFGVTRNSLPWLKDEHLVSLAEENKHLFHLKKYDPGSRHDLRWRDLIDHFSKLQSFGVTPEAYSKFVQKLVEQADAASRSTILGGRTEKEKELILQYRVDYASGHKEIADAYQTFANLKEENGKFSLVDRLPHAASLIGQDSVRNQLLGRYKHILIDQIEDWGRLDWNVLEALLFFPRSLKERTFTIFGDDDLAIMEWAGAPRDAFARLSSALPSKVLLPLTIDFRNETAVLDAAKALISHNSGRLEHATGILKTMASFQEYQMDGVPAAAPKTRQKKAAAADPKVYHLEFASESDEVHGISDLLRKLLHPPDGTTDAQVQQPQPSIGIITRFRSDALNLCKQLQAVGAPVPSPLIEHSEVKFLVNILKVVLEPSEPHALYDLLCSGMFSIPGACLAKVTELHQRSKEPLRNVLEEYLKKVLTNKEELDAISKEDARLLKRATKLLALLSLLESHVGTDSLRQLVYITLKETKVLTSHRNPHSESEEQQGDNIAKFISLIEDAEAKLQNTRPAFVWPTIKRVVMHTPTGTDLDDNIGVIPVRTAWASKGYEYDYVILPHMSDDRFPGRLKRNELQELLHQAAGFNMKETEHISQMRRVLYVAMTRARKGVIFTYHTKAPHGGRVPLKISRFVPEALGLPNAKFLPKVAAPISADQSASSLERSNTTSSPSAAGSNSPPRATSSGKKRSQESPVFGGGVFTLKDQKHLPPLSMHGLQVYLRCPLQFYQQFVINVSVPVTPLQVFQEAIGAVLHAISTQQVNSNNLSSFYNIRKCFDKTWEAHGINPVSNPEMYEQGMALSETLLDSEEEHHDLIHSSASWKLSASVPTSSQSPVANTTAVDPSEPQWDKKNKKNQIEFADAFHRVYSGHNVRHFLQYSESAPPDTPHLQQVSKVLAWAYYKSHKTTPKSVTLEYINSRFQMRMLQFAPTPQLMVEAEAYVTSLAKAMASGKFEAAASLQNCRKCPFSSSCPSSAAPKM